MRVFVKVLAKFKLEVLQFLLKKGVMKVPCALLWLDSHKVRYVRKMVFILIGRVAESLEHGERRSKEGQKIPRKV